MNPTLKLTDSSPVSIAGRNTRLILCLLYGIMAQTYTNLFWKTTVDVGPARLNDLANFTAMRPYQYRVLVPAIVHFLAKLTHADKYQVLPLYQAIEWLAVFASFWVFRAYLATFTTALNAAFMSLFLLPAMLFMHQVCALGHYPYDTPQILLFTLGLLALRKQNWPLFYLTLIVASFNRESSVLLIPAFGLVMYDKIAKPKLIAHLAFQSVIFAAIKLSLDHIFLSNLGDFTENHVAYNVLLISKMLHGNTVIISTAILLTVTALLLITGRKYVPEFANRLLWLLPFYVGVMWRVGVLDEIRAYNEMAPVVLVPLLLILQGNLKDSHIAESEATDNLDIDLQKAA